MAEPFVVECSASCAVTVQIEPKPPTPEMFEDLTLAFGLMFLALIPIWGGKLLYNFFNRGPSDGQ